MENPDPSDLRDLQRIEDEEAEKHAAEAQQQALRALDRATVEAAREAILAAQESAGASAELRAISGMDRIRQAIDPVLSEDLEAGRQQVIAAAHAAMVDGYETDLQGHVHLHNQRDPEVAAAAEVDDAERRRLRGYPVQGHTVEEWSTWLHEQLRFHILGLLVDPLVGAARLEQIPARIDEQVAAHSRRVAGFIDNAYLAGTQAASILWRAWVRRLAREVRDADSR